MKDNYWAKRQLREQDAITAKTEEDIDKQLRKYYKNTMQSVINSFESTYDKLLNTIEEGREPTPADLYNLSKYWQMQGQLKQEMQKLGDREIILLSKKFEKQWIDVYNSIALPSNVAFSTIDEAVAKQMINSIWLSDGKTFSQRIWKNIEKLTETLNDKLIECVVSGKKTTELKNLLQERFNVSYNQANMLVRTETANIQTQAAAQRYKDYGLTKYEYLGREEHDIGCNCKKLNGKIFSYAEMQTGINAPPLHPFVVAPLYLLWT